MNENDLHPILKTDPYPIPPILDDLDYADNLDFWIKNLRGLAESVLETDPSETGVKLARAIRRSVNTIIGQIDDDYSSMLSDRSADPLSVHKAIAALEKKFREIVKPVKGTHAHHGDPLEAIGKSIGHLPGRRIQEIKKELLKRGYRTGGDAQSMAPYSAGGHLGNALGGDPTWTDIAAHTDLIASAQQDRWVHSAGSPFVDVVPADLSLEEQVEWLIDRTVEPQRLVNLAAWNTEDERASRSVMLDAAKQAGLPFNPLTTTDQDLINQSRTVLGGLGLNSAAVRKQVSKNGTLRFAAVTGTLPPMPELPPAVEAIIKPVASKTAAAKPVAAKPPKPVAAKPAPAKPAIIPTTAARKPGTKSIAAQTRTAPAKPSSTPAGMTVTKLPPSKKGTLKVPKPPKNTPSTPSSRPRGTTGVQILSIDAPSQERYGPAGLIGTIDQPHERQHSWRR